MICERCGTIFCADEAFDTIAGYDEDGWPIAFPKLYCSKGCKSKAAEKRRLKRERKLSAQLAACARQYKVRYDSKHRAHEDAKRLTRRVGQKLYPYECACGWWHLTSRRREPAVA